jgi:hypothetical protein
MSRLTSILTLGFAAAVLAVPAAAQKKGDRNLIVADELAEKSMIGNAHDAVRTLRPNWLRVRTTGYVGAPSAGGAGRDKPLEPAVYVDEAKMYALDDLKNVSAREIQEIRYLSGNAAVARWGSGHEYGAIMVTTIRRAKP